MSKVLLLTVCSNHKIETKQQIEYNAKGSFSDLLPTRLRASLNKTRDSVRKLIMSGEISRDGKPLSEMPYNARLIDGPDFGGKVTRGMYLPALLRYSGRFYRELGDTDLDRVQLAASSAHHTLIISGLYGLLTPMEMIQCYSCHVPDHPDIAGSWTRDDLLTRLLIDYIKRNDIKRVFDLIAIDAYRNLISWEMIRHATKHEVLHCFSKQFAGADLLPSLGWLAHKFLDEMSESDLADIKAEQSIAVPDDTISFLPFPVASLPFAREQLKPLTALPATSETEPPIAPEQLKPLTALPATPEIAPPIAPEQPQPPAPKKDRDLPPPHRISWQKRAVETDLSPAQTVSSPTDKKPEPLESQNSVSIPKPKIAAPRIEPLSPSSPEGALTDTRGKRELPDKSKDSSAIQEKKNTLDDKLLSIERSKSAACINDQLGRMRRNYIKILNKIVNGSRGGSFSQRAQQVADYRLEHSYNVSQHMLDFAQIRNRVEYGGYLLDAQSSDWQKILIGYRWILHWAEKHGFTKGIIIESVEN